MAWIQQIPPAEASGLLKQEFDKAEQRAGRVWNVVAVMSQNAVTMKHSMLLYGGLMHGRSPLSCAQRELLATVVSVENHCLY